MTFLALDAQKNLFTLQKSQLQFEQTLVMSRCNYITKQMGYRAQELEASDIDTDDDIPEPNPGDTDTDDDKPEPNPGDTDSDDDDDIPGIVTTGMTNEQISKLTNKGK